MHQIQATARLYFSLMSDSDKALLWELDQDPQVMKHINGGIPTSQNDIMDIFLPRLNSYTNAQKGWGLWKVQTRANDAFIGWVLVRPMHFFSQQPELDNLELGWRFKRAYWGKGYATEAANGVKASFTQVQYPYTLRKFSAIAVKENTASINIMHKIGMRYEKTALHQDPLGDQMLAYYCEVI